MTNTFGKWNLPFLGSVKSIAEALQMQTDQLEWLIDAPPKISPKTGVSIHYSTKEIPKKKGAKRLLLIPKARLMDAQYWILESILEKVEPHEAAHGFRAGRSILTHAASHEGKRVVVCCDLKDFFPSIRAPRVRGLFEKLGYSREVARALAFLCTTRLPRGRKRILPQGAPTSPAISNLVARNLDRRCSALAKRMGFVYTRYADDCTFSGDRNLVTALTKYVGKIIKDERFFLNHEKLRVMRKSVRQKVTGIVVNHGFSVPREERRRLRAILHNAAKSGLAAQNRGNRVNYVEHMRGKIAFVKMVNPKQAIPLQEVFERVKDR